MLSDEERREIQSELPLYPNKRAVGPEALKIVQRHRGWVSDEALKDLSEVLELTPAELDSVATFYNLVFRKPVGRHVIFLCDSVSCWILGYEGLYEHLRSRLGIAFGETTPDGRFTLLPIVCLGDCDHAPVMMVDQEQYGDLTPDKIDAILAHYAERDRLAAEEREVMPQRRRKPTRAALRQQAGSESAGDAPAWTFPGNRSESPPIHPGRGTESAP